MSEAMQVKVFCMNGGEGETSHANNFSSLGLFSRSSITRSIIFLASQKDVMFKAKPESWMTISTQYSGFCLASC